MSKTTTEQIDAIIEKIAIEEIPGIETLETRRSDSLDFHDVAVWCIQEALRKAYAAGVAAGKQSK